VDTLKSDDDDDDDDGDDDDDRFWMGRCVKLQGTLVDLGHRMQQRIQITFWKFLTIFH